MLVYLKKDFTIFWKENTLYLNNLKDKQTYTICDLIEKDGKLKTVRFCPYNSDSCDIKHFNSEQEAKDNAEWFADYQRWNIIDFYNTEINKQLTNIFKEYENRNEKKMEK